MHYRYFGFTILAVFFSLMGIQTSAACQEIRFPDGQSFCFDLQKVETERFQAKISSIQVDTKDLSCILTLPNTTTVNLPKCEGFFQYEGAGAGKITLRADIPNYWYELMTHYDFNKGSFESSNPITSDYLPEISGISSENPDLDEEIDLRLRVKNNASSSSYRGTAYFRVEKLQNGRWESASSSDYELKYNRYTFSATDQGEKYFDDLLRFKRSGEFRLYVELEGGNATYKSLKVRENSWYRSYTPEWFGASDSSPDEDEWVSINLRIHKANHNEEYEGRVEFRVEEYRNGSWR